MKKVGLVLMALVIFAGCGFSEAGEWCFQISNFEEYVKLEVKRTGTRNAYWTLHGVWYDAGYDFIAPISGTMVKSADGTERLLSLSGSFLFGSDFSQIYTAQAIIDGQTKNGTLYIHYDLSGLSNNFPFTKVKCNTVPPPYVAP